MNISRVAYRYAEAAYDSLPDGVGMDVFLRDLSALQSSVDASRDLFNFFLSPVITATKKREIVQEIYSGKLDDYLVGFILFLIDKKREMLVLEIIEAIQRIYRKRNNILDARIVSAAEIPTDQRLALENQLILKTKMTVEPQYHTDSALIGGVVVQVGDTVYDGSIARQLKRLHQTFLS